MDIKDILSIIALAGVITQTVYIFKMRRETMDVRRNISIMAERILTAVVDGHLDNDGFNDIMDGMIKDENGQSVRGRVCRKCGNLMPEEAFSPGKNICKDCRNEMRRRKK